MNRRQQEPADHRDARPSQAMIETDSTTLQVELSVAIGAPALQTFAAATELLDGDERARAARFRFEADRTLFRAAHVLLRRALSRHAPIAPADWRFVRSAHGRPEIDLDACPAAAGLRFNLSHSRAFACCAVCRDAALGIDCEGHRPMRDRRALAERFFAPAEAAVVAGLEDRLIPTPRWAEPSAPSSAGPDPADLAFYAYWTLKEAYVKAVGRGLALGLDRFSFGFGPGDPSRVALSRYDGLEDAIPAGHWRFLLLRTVADDATLAMAVASEGQVSVRIRGAATAGPYRLRRVAADEAVRLAP